MNKKRFDLLLDFHKKLIRAKPLQKTIELTEEILVNDLDQFKGIDTNLKYGAISLANNLLDRELDLEGFYKSDWEGKVKIYNRAYKKNPNPAVFDALKLVYDCGLTYGASSVKCGVNLQSVKSLRIRFDFYTDTANKLNAL